MGRLRNSLQKSESSNKRHFPIFIYGRYYRCLVGLIKFLGTLGFRSLPGPYDQYLACAAQVNPYNSTYPELPLAWEQFFRCSLNDSADIPYCSTDYAKRDFDSPCRCTGQENFAQIPPDVRLLFSF